MPSFVPWHKRSDSVAGLRSGYFKCLGLHHVYNTAEQTAEGVGCPIWSVGCNDVQQWSWQ